MHISNLLTIRACRPAWNKGRIVGQKRPLLPKHVWAIRVRLEIADNYSYTAQHLKKIEWRERGTWTSRLDNSRVHIPEISNISKDLEHNAVWSPTIRG